MAKKDFMGLMKEKTVDVRPSLLSAEENIKSQLIILDQLRELIPPLTDEELAQLEQNVLTHGVKDPLTIWETTDTVAGTGSDGKTVYVLIDGHNRNRIITRHQLDFRINLVRFDSLDEVKAYMIDYQLGRRNLTPEQASYLRGTRYNQQKARRGSNLRADGSVVNVADKLAAEYGVSSRTIKRDGEFAASLETVGPTLKRDVLAGKAPKSAVQKAISDDTAPAADDTDSPADAPAAPVDSRVARRLETLKNQIRQLATGDLTSQDCSQLIQKTNDLMTLLQSPK
jgi:hypothetical protein